MSRAAYVVEIEMRELPHLRAFVDRRSPPAHRIYLFLYGKSPARFQRNGQQASRRQKLRDAQR
jgi:hypothetical protein